MPNIAVILKAEIARVARKQVRSETASLKKALATYRGEIAALKRRAQQLEQALRHSKKASPAEKTNGEALASVPHRFSAKGLASNRRRLGLSAQQLGLLVGASGQSVYLWESGKARPRASHLEAIAALRSLGKKQAAQVVESRQHGS